MPVLIDFYADWCISCRELEQKTWPHPSVQSELEHFICVKMDLTKTGVETKSIQDKYGVVGMPTIILFDSTGKELFRFEGFKPPEDVAEILRRFSGSNA
jgi:thiol:disulfide interchange protein DsbD